MSWGARLRAAREAVDLNQREVARRLAGWDPLGARPSTWQALLSRLEAGAAVSSPRAGIGRELAGLLGAPELAQGVPVIGRQAGRAGVAEGEGARVRRVLDALGWSVRRAAAWSALEDPSRTPETWRKAWGDLYAGRDGKHSKAMVRRVLTHAGELARTMRLDSSGERPISQPSSAEMGSLPASPRPFMVGFSLGENPISPPIQLFPGASAAGTSLGTRGGLKAPHRAKEKPRNRGSVDSGAALSTS